MLKKVIQNFMKNLNLRLTHIVRFFVFARFLLILFEMVSNIYY